MGNGKGVQIAFHVLTLGIPALIRVVKKRRTKKALQKALDAAVRARG